MPSRTTSRRPSSLPVVTGYPHLVTTCGSRPAARWGRVAWGGGLADAGVGAGEDGLLGEEGGAEAAGSAGWGGTEAADPAGWGGVEGLAGVGEAAFAPGPAGGAGRGGTGRRG